MAKQAYKLIVRDCDETTEVLRSSDADVLRTCGAAMARRTAPSAELMLVDPRGKALAAFDIWSSQWQAAA